MDLEDINERLTKLEEAVFSREKQAYGSQAHTKSITLPEISRKKTAKNGQQKVALIVGYYEMILREAPVGAETIQSGWKEGKFEGNYNPSFLFRAIKDGLVRDLKDGNYDLTQSGEDFFKEASR